MNKVFSSADLRASLIKDSKQVSLIVGSQLRPDFLAEAWKLVKEGIFNYERGCFCANAYYGKSQEEINRLEAIF
jgi:hypothetical protein